MPIGLHSIKKQAPVKVSAVRNVKKGLPKDFIEEEEEKNITMYGELHNSPAENICSARCTGRVCPFESPYIGKIHKADTNPNKYC